MISNSIIRLALDHLGCMTNFYIHYKVLSILLLRKKCPNTEFFWFDLSVFSPMRENTDQKKLRIWTFFTHFFICCKQCYFIYLASTHFMKLSIENVLTLLSYLYSPDHMLYLHNMFRQFFNFIGNHLTNLLGLYEDLNHYLPFGGAKCWKIKHFFS